MSVKNLTTQQLRGDLEALARLFPGGIPTEQYDRVNAIKGELKRRGEDARVAAPTPQPEKLFRALDDLTDSQLETELSTVQKNLNRDPSDEDMQTRFADIRFEQRKRAKASQAEQPSRPALPPRALEIPTDAVAPTAEMAYLDVTSEVKNTRTSAANGTMMEHIEKQHMKVALAQTAAVVAARLLLEAEDVNGDSIENSCDTAVSVAAIIFAKVGL